MATMVAWDMRAFGEAAEPYTLNRTTRVWELHLPEARWQQELVASGFAERRGFLTWCPTWTQVAIWNGYVTVQRMERGWCGAERLPQVGPREAAQLAARRARMVADAGNYADPIDAELARIAADAAERVVEHANPYVAFVEAILFLVSAERFARLGGEVRAYDRLGDALPEEWTLAYLWRNGGAGGA